jgi:hypothetical protein
MSFTSEEVEKLLRTSKDRALYDKWNGIRRNAMIAIGFYPSYLTYHAGQKPHKLHAPNWVSARTVFRENMRDNKSGIWRIVHWTFWPGLPSVRPNLTHARGFFVDREKKLVIIYEPRKLEAKDLEKAQHRMYNKAHSEFCKYFGAKYRFVTVFGSQVRSWDCEKRVLRFGFCCLKEVIGVVNHHGLQEIKCENKKCWLKVSAILPFYKRR